MQGTGEGRASLPPRRSQRQAATPCRCLPHGTQLPLPLVLPQGELVFRDPPLVGMQNYRNRKHCLVCARCFRFAGSIELQVSCPCLPCPRGARVATLKSHADRR